MSLSPEEIEAREFPVRMRGYDQDEVHKFLGAVANELRGTARRVGGEMLREAEAEARTIITAAERAVGQRMSDLTRREQRLEEVLGATRAQLQSIFTLLLAGDGAGTFVEPIRSATTPAGILDRAEAGLIALEELFRLVALVERTGRLDLVFGDGWGKVFFESGKVAYSESSLPRQPLGEKLLRAGVVTEEQLEEALADQARSREQVGKILIAAGALTLEQLADALRAQIAEAVAPFLKRPLGDFTWTPAEHITLGVPVVVKIEDIIGSPAFRELPSMGLF